MHDLQTHRLALHRAAGKGSQPDRARTMTPGGCRGNVIELGAISRRTKKETAPTQIPASDELRRKEKALAEEIEKDVEIFSGGDAPEKDDGSSVRPLGETPGIADQRISITAIVRIDVDPGETSERSLADRGFGRYESRARRDHEDA